MGDIKQWITVSYTVRSTTTYCNLKYIHGARKFTHPYCIDKAELSSPLIITQESCGKSITIGIINCMHADT